MRSEKSISRTSSDLESASTIAGSFAVIALPLLSDDKSHKPFSSSAWGLARRNPFSLHRSKTKAAMPVLDPGHFVRGRQFSCVLGANLSGADGLFGLFRLYR